MVVPLWDDEDGVRFAVTLRRAYREATSCIGRVLAANHLSQLEYHLLLELAGADAGLGQSQLARDLQAPKTRISLLVRGLQERGLVESVRPDHDRRQVWVRITPEGTERLRASRLAVQETLVAFVASLPTAQVVKLLEGALRAYLRLDVTVTLRGHA
jgi:DNA-binding MarR family transcriptional regulator